MQEHAKEEHSLKPSERFVHRLQFLSHFFFFFSIIFHVNVVIVLQLELKCCACDVSEVEVFAT